MIDRLNVEQCYRPGEAPDRGQGNELPRDAPGFIGKTNTVIIGTCLLCTQHAVRNYQFRSRKLEDAKSKEKKFFYTYLMIFCKTNSQSSTDCNEMLLISFKSHYCLNGIWCPR